VVSARTRWLPVQDLGRRRSSRVGTPGFPRRVAPEMTRVGHRIIVADTPLPLRTKDQHATNAGRFILAMASEDLCRALAGEGAGVDLGAHLSPRRDTGANLRQPVHGCNCPGRPNPPRGRRADDGVGPPLTARREADVVLRSPLTPVVPVSYAPLVPLAALPDWRCSHASEVTIHGTLIELFVAGPRRVLSVEGRP
jgi:hypothetical protein